MKNWTLARTITVVLGTSWALCLISSGLFLLRMHSLAEAYKEEIYLGDRARVMQLAFKKQVQEWKDILLRGHETPALRQHEEAFHRQEKAVAALAAELRVSLTDADIRSVVDEFATAQQTLGKRYESALNVFKDSNGQAYREADRMVKGQDRAPTDLIDKLVALMAQRNAQHERAFQIHSLELTSVLLLLVALSATMSIGVIRRVNRALARAVQEIASSAEQVSAAAAQVSASSQNLAQGSSEQAASLEETSMSTEEIATNTQRNVDASRECSSLMVRAQEIGKGGREVASQLVETVANINFSSQEIAKILSVIDGIAFQTNILALNAAVEAARAGEAGTGFAVVADEVRNLAHRCAEASSKTAVLVKSSVASAREGQARLDALNHSLGESAQIRKDVQRVADDVEGYSNKQKRGVDQIVRAIKQMEQVTQSNAASAEQGASAAAELVAQSNVMKDIVRNLCALVGDSEG